jgi:hypothetical protein
MEVNFPPERTDLRCAVCRQKNTFHCEHDTPYRDIYLGMYDEDSSGPSLVHSQRLKEEAKTREHNGTNQKRPVKSNTGAQNQQGKTPDNIVHENPENNTSKSCTIL